MRKRRVWWIPALLLLIVLTATTASPMSTSKFSTAFIQHETNASYAAVKKMNYIARKSAHVIVFGSLAIMLAIAMGMSKLALLAAWVLATLCGAVDELHQMMVPDRSASLHDVYIDSAGAAVFLILYAIYLFVKKRWIRRK